LNFLDNDKKICSSFTPKKGSAIIFNSDALHEGELLMDGHKFMMRYLVLLCIVVFGFVFRFSLMFVCFFLFFLVFFFLILSASLLSFY
jgi:hypothetical protein